jgi:PAS domain S-box-containing protein
VVITYNDVTELKQAEERSHHLASFPQLNPNPVIEVDTSGTVTFANPAARKTLENLGLDKDDAAAFLPADLEDILKDLENKEEATLYRERRVKDRLFGATVQCLPQFNVLRIYAFDITERRRAEEAVRRAKEEWERTFDSVPDMIAILDNEHRIQRVNASMARRLGRTPAECIGLRCHEYVHGTSVPPEFCPHSRTLADRCEHIEEVHEDRLGGSFLVSTTPLCDVQGRMVGSVHVAHDITRRKEAEDALRESELRVRSKLESILSPEGDIANLELGDIIDSPAIQSLMEKFYDLTHIPLAVIDLKGTVLVGAGWQEVCTKFHRVHPETCGNCMESDTRLTAGMPAGEYKLYKCKNNMWDVATPIEVSGKQLGHFFTGQFFFDDESPDYELFRAQAKQYGFDEQEYLTALDKVPRLSRATVDTVMGFFMKLSGMISQLSYSNIKLARILSERDILTESLRESQEHLNRAQEIARLGSWELDIENNNLSWSDEVYRIFGLQPQEFGATYGAFLERVHPDDRAAVDTAYSDSLREGKGTYEIEHRVVRKSDGEVRIVHEKCEHFRDASGKITRSIGMVHDITERKQAEEILRLNNEELTRFNRVAVGRELRMIELKKEVNDLRAKAGEPPHYKTDLGEEQQ